MEAGKGSNMNPANNENSSLREMNNNGSLSAQDDHQSAVPKKEILLPASNIEKIMKRALPQHAIIEGETVQLMQEYVSEFIHKVTIGANEESQNAGRKTVRANDIMSAIEKSGKITEYILLLTAHLEEYRKQEYSKRINVNNASTSLALNVEDNNHQRATGENLE